MKSMKSSENIKYFSVSIILGITICLLSYDFVCQFKGELINDITQTLISLYGTMLGFLITSLAIILSLLENKFIKKIIQSGHYFNLLDSCKILSSLYFIAIILLVINLFLSGSYKYYLFIAIIFLSVSIVIFSMRTAYKFFQTFKFLASNNKNT